jgi:hypothetical protein
MIIHNVYFWLKAGTTENNKMKFETSYIYKIAKWQLFFSFLVLQVFISNAQDFESSHLPIVVINTQGSDIRDEPKIDADMGIINNSNGLNNVSDPFNDYDGKIAIEIRGNSTQLFDKKSYGFELRDELGEDQDVSLIGLPEEEDWILYASPIDKTHMRNVITLELWRKMGYWASNTRYCELVLNGEYRGTYVLMEKIKRDENRLDIARLNPEDTEGDDLTGGYIIRMDWPKGDGWYSKYNSMGGDRLFFQYLYPKTEDITSQQKLYIRQYISDFEDALFDGNFVNNDGVRYSSLVGLSSFADLFIINELSRSVDAYKISSFIHKDKGSNGGRLKAGPIWDFNLAYGNVVYCGGSKPSGWTYKQLDNQCDDLSLMPLWWERFMEDEVFKNLVACRWQDYREDFLNEAFLFDFIDHQVNELGVAVDRNFEKWNYLGENLWDEPNPVPTTYKGEIERLKNWFTDRIAWLDKQMINGDCTITAIDELDSDVTVYPNPFNSSFTMSFSGLKNMKFQMTDMSGRLLISYDDVSDQIIIDGVDYLKNGIYLIYLSKDRIHNRRTLIKN